MGDDDLLEPEESEETIPGAFEESEETIPGQPDELGLADEEEITEELDLAEGEEEEGMTETIEEVEGEAEVEEDLGEEMEGMAAAPMATGEPIYDPSAAEHLPPSKPRSNVYTTMLILAFLFFGLAIYLAGDELHRFYHWKAFGLLEK